MREMKIRAWVHGSGQKRMIAWEDIDAIEWCNDKLWYGDGKYVLLGNVVLMEYCNCADSKEVDVYEGDIIRFYYFHTYEQRSFPEYVDFRETEIREAKGVVYWDESDLCWSVKPVNDYKTKTGDCHEHTMTPVFLAWCGLCKEQLEEYNKDFDDADKTPDTFLGFEIIGNIHDQTDSANQGKQEISSMIKTVMPSNRITVHFECFDDLESEGAKYCAWIEDEPYKGIVVSGNTIDEVFKELGISLRVLELYRKNLKTNHQCKQNKPV